MKNVNVAVSKKADVVAVAAESVETPTLSVVKKGPLFRVVDELTQADFIAAGATEEELSRKQERMVAIDAGNAKLVFGKNTKGRIRDVLVEGQIVGSSSLVSSELDYKILILHTTERTYFTLLPGVKLFGFYIPVATKNAQEAVVGLIANNLARGKDTFEKTAERLYPQALFLWELIQAVCPEDVVLDMTLTSGTRSDTSTAPAKLFVYPGDRAKTTLSIAGYCHDFNFKDYPAYYQDAFKRAKVSQGKLNHKLNTLIMDKAAQFKPTQKKRSEKAIQVDQASRQKLVEELSGTMRSVRERAHELGQEKPTKAKTKPSKAPEKTAKEGKKKK